MTSPQRIGLLSRARPIPAIFRASMTSRWRSIRARAISGVISMSSAVPGRSAGCGVRDDDLERD